MKIKLTDKTTFAQIKKIASDILKHHHDVWEKYHSAGNYSFSAQVDYLKAIDCPNGFSISFRQDTGEPYSVDMKLV